MRAMAIFGVENMVFTDAKSVIFRSSIISGALTTECKDVFSAVKRQRAFLTAVSLFFLLFASLFLSSCGSKSASKTVSGAPEQSVRSFAPAGIQVQYAADKMLNVYDNEPHTLILAVYQLSNVNAFNNLTKNSEGLKTLLKLQNFDASAVGMDKIIVQPGEDKNVALNRAENATWIGIVGGYFTLVPGQVNRLFSIPLITRKKGVYGFRTTESRVGQMTIKLLLGPSALQEREVIVE
jgi:type VI secretion system VasD/TssJ family lipoprotein